MVTVRKKEDQLKTFVTWLSLGVFVTEAFLLLLPHFFNQAEIIFIPAFNIHYFLFYMCGFLFLILGSYFFIIRKCWSYFLIFLMGSAGVSTFVVIIIMTAGEGYLFGTPYIASEVKTEKEGHLMLSRYDSRTGVFYQLWRKDQGHFSQMVWKHIPVKVMPAPFYQFAGQEGLIIKEEKLFIKRQSIWTDCFIISTFTPCHLENLTSSPLSPPETEDAWRKRSSIIKTFITPE